MRNKLHLTEDELMNKSWIALNLEMRDYPYYDYKAKKTATTRQEEEFFAKLMR